MNELIRYVPICSKCARALGHFLAPASAVPMLDREYAEALCFPCTQNPPVVDVQ